MTKSKILIAIFILIFCASLFLTWQNIFGNKVSKFDKMALQKIASVAKLNKSFLLEEINLSLQLKDLNNKVTSKNLEIKKEYVVTNSIFINPENNLGYNPFIKYKFIKFKFNPKIEQGEIPFGYYQLSKNLTVTTNRYIADYSIIKTLRKDIDKANNLVITSIFIGAKSNYVYLGQKRFKIQFQNNLVNFKIGSMFFSEFKEAKIHLYLPFICYYKNASYDGVFIGLKDFRGEKNITGLILRAKIYKNNKPLCYLFVKSDNTIKISNLNDKEIFNTKPRINNRLLRK
ncbi:MAG: hypothetical protein WC860_01945 [Candidatus Margulisiibacteriota bacterium]|jgi:hypothetical protein